VELDRLTFVCATTAEERVARRAGRRTALIGLGGHNGVPEGDLVSFGIAGGLGELEPGDVIDAVRVVDEHGTTLWEGAPLGVAGARHVTIVAMERVVDAADERRRLQAESGAVAVDMESGVLARTGRLRGVLRAISDTPEEPLGRLATSVRLDGRLAWGNLLRGFVCSPLATVRAARNAQYALTALRRSARG
jgi:hypothetical protein